MSEPRTRFLVGGREQGRRLDRFLQEHLPKWSRTRIQQTIRERVRLSWGVKARPSTPVRAGGEILIDWEPPEEELLELEIPIVDRGPGWLAIDKPPGIPVHPVGNEFENTIVRMMRRQCGNEAITLVHRLDRETSGAMLLASETAVAKVRAQAFLKDRVQKEYLAVVFGVPMEESGEIELPIGEAEESRVYTRRGIDEEGQPSLTRWQLEARYETRSLLRLFPKTGRRHQLRVHLEAIGHPILGDILYGRSDTDYLRLAAGDGDARKEQPGPKRQLLHCAKLAFDDGLTIEVPPPADFAEALR